MVPTLSPATTFLDRTLATANRAIVILLLLGDVSTSMNARKILTIAIRLQKIAPTPLVLLLAVVNSDTAGRQGVVSMSMNAPRAVSAAPTRHAPILSAAITVPAIRAF